MPCRAAGVDDSAAVVAGNGLFCGLARPAGSTPPGGGGGGADMCLLTDSIFWFIVVSRSRLESTFITTPTLPTPRLWTVSVMRTTAPYIAFMSADSSMVPIGLSWYLMPFMSCMDSMALAM